MMTVSVEKIVIAALDRMKSAVAEAERVSAYSGTTDHLSRAQQEMDVAIELLSLIVSPSKPPANDPA